VFVAIPVVMKTAAEGSARHFFFAGFDSRFAAAARGRPCLDFATVPFAFFVFFAAAFTTALAGTAAGVSGAGARA